MPRLPRNKARKREKYHCDQCGYEWYGRKDPDNYKQHYRPLQCPQCKASYLWTWHKENAPFFKQTKEILEGE